MNSILDKALNYYLAFNILELVASIIIFILIVYYVTKRRK